MITMEEKEIDRKCGWCGSDMGTVKGNFKHDHDVTHGICKECKDKFLCDVEQDNKG